ncbi:P-loop NTPase family protein [Williamsia sterculiae]|uniref:AAA-like domain-containing protein n=1 Tax=Williamsia sterculiae TaxID=1344003 RepID=A0A1N7HEW4_9NOCA|nr:hypothetical protein [Williamsia sterculiae]SIS23258.1 hypothetical protein SAMN05445060_4084 [Williamsia sterculiae]
MTSAPARHRAADGEVAEPPVTAAEQYRDIVGAEDPTGMSTDGDRVRIGGQWILTDDAYTRLQDMATRRGWKGRRARKRITAEKRRHRAAIENMRVTGGFDVETPVFTPRGYKGAGGGRMLSIGKLPEYRGTSTQVGGGMYPFCFGARSPVLGTPSGHHMVTGADFGFDPLTWFTDGPLTAPVLFMLALNGYGKSTEIRHMVLGMIAQGCTAIFPDTKPDYVMVTDRVVGQVSTLSYGRHAINPLAIGGLASVLARLGQRKERRRADEALADRVRSQCRARQVTAVVNLLELKRKEGSVADWEETVLAAALTVLYANSHAERFGRFDDNHPPLIENLYAVIDANLPELFADSGADTADQYRALTLPLRQGLRALTQGPFGQVFNAHSTEPVDLSHPAVTIDLSQIPEGDRNLLAAVLLTCWSDCFGAIEAAHVLADAGLAPRRTFILVMDELWRILRAGAGMIDRVDELTRLNRQMGVVLIMITHTLKDLASFESEADVQKALGFIERAQAKIIGPVGDNELNLLSRVVSFTETDRARIAEFASAPPPDDKRLAKERAQYAAEVAEARARGDVPPPKRIREADGTGCFMLKIGTGGKEDPGIPFRLTLSQFARDANVHNTNQAFESSDDDVEVIDAVVVDETEALL